MGRRDRAAVGRRLVGPWLCADGGADGWENCGGLLFQRSAFDGAVHRGYDLGSGEKVKEVEYALFSLAKGAVFMKVSRATLCVALALTLTSNFSLPRLSAQVNATATFS